MLGLKSIHIRERRPRDFRYNVVYYNTLFHTAQQGQHWQNQGQNRDKSMLIKWAMDTINALYDGSLHTAENEVN